MNIQKAIAGTAIFAALALNVTPVLAQGSYPSDRPLPRPSFSPRPIPSGNRVAEMCQRVAKGIDNRIDKFQRNNEGFVTSSKNLLDRINKLVQKADSKGLDTTKVKADLLTLTDKVNKLTSDHQTFVTDLQAAKAINCVQNPDQFRTALKSAQSQFSVLKSDWTDIKNFFQNTIKPDVLALRNQLPHPSTSPSPTATP